MDPTSLVASSIAAADAVALSSGAIKMLCELRNCLYEVFALANELSDLQYALLQFPRLIQSLSHSVQLSQEIRNLLLHTGSRLVQTIESLKKLIEKLKKIESLGGRLHQNFITRRRWQREQANIGQLRNEIRETRLAMMLALNGASMAR